MNLIFEKNKTYHYSFFFIIFLYSVFNGGNSNFLIQINFLIVCLFFFICTLKKNYKSHLNFFFNKNRVPIIFFSLFLIYVIFQIIPLPLEIIKYFSNEKYLILQKMKILSNKNSLSLSPSNTFFQFLNFLTIFLIILISKMIFYREAHIHRFFTFISLLGSICSFVAIISYLNGNEDFFFIKNSYFVDSSTGFFINRTVLSIFLLFCFISSLEILKNKSYLSKNSNKNFYFKIYIRLFVVIITIGIVTTFSRLGNFLFIMTIFFYFMKELLKPKEKDKSFLYLIILIIIFDILILGSYFGYDKLLLRFYFLQDQITLFYNEENNITRLNLIYFSLDQIKNFLFFGYGGGSFETLFQIKYNLLSNKFADHAHSDFLEFFGEYGLIGLGLIFLTILKFLLNKKNYSFINLILFFKMIVILIFDFSLHIPIIQILFIIFFLLNEKNLIKSHHSS